MAGGVEVGPLVLPAGDDPRAWPAVIITNAIGVVTFWNPAAEKLYGWPSSEAVGKSILDINVEAADHDRAADIMARLAAGGTWEGRFPVRRQDGSTFLAWVADAPLLDLDASLVGIIGMSVPAHPAAGDREAGPPQPVPNHRLPRPGRKTAVAVYGEAHHRAPLEALIRANPDRVELAQCSPAVILVAAGSGAPYDLVDVRALSCRAASAPAVVAVARRPSDDVALECIRRNFRGYLRADLNDAELLDAIEQAADGRVVIDRALSGETGRRAALAELAHPHIVNRWDLRRREMEALTYLASGLSNRDIARRMVVGEETVKSYLKSVYRKLGVRDRTGAVATALRPQLPTERAV